MALSTGLLVGGSLSTEVLVHLGLATLVLTCSHGLRRAVVARDEALRGAFELGRDFERSQSLRTVQ